MSNNSEDGEEVRLCPTCRETISVWATKCRYCGELVGRPKKEESHFTAKELGGQTQKVYTLSGNVTDALENFRVEEATAPDEEATGGGSGFLRRFRGKKKTESGQVRREEGLPELDEYHRSLTSGNLDRPPSTSRRPAKQQSSEFPEKVLKLGAVVVGLVILGFVGDYSWTKISTYLENRNRVEEFVYENRARAWMDAGRPNSDILLEAQTAYGHNATDENRQILDEARDRFIHDVEQLLAKNPFNKANHDEASRLMSRVITNRAGPVLLELDKKVRSEIAYYSMTLNDISGDSARFTLNNPEYHKSEETVSKGDLLQDRFKVIVLTRTYVVLLDTKAPGGGGRELEMERLSYPRGRS